MKTLDVVFRVAAALLGIIFLAGISVFIRRLTALEGLLALSNVVLMAVFVISRYGKSVPQLCLFGIVLILVLIDFGTTGLPNMRNEGYPGDVLSINILEYLVIAWFGARHFFLRNREKGLSRVNAGPDHK